MFPGYAENLRIDDCLLNTYTYMYINIIYIVAELKMRNGWVWKEVNRPGLVGNVALASGFLFGKRGVHQMW